MRLSKRGELEQEPQEPTELGIPRSERKRHLVLASSLHERKLGTQPVHHARRFVSQFPNPPPVELGTQARDFVDAERAFDALGFTPLGRSQALHATRRGEGELDEQPIAPAVRHVTRVDENDQRRRRAALRLAPSFVEQAWLGREQSAESPDHVGAQLLVVVTLATGKSMLPLPPPTSTLM